jgi:hypothetical protein
VAQSFPVFMNRQREFHSATNIFVSSLLLFVYNAIVWVASAAGGTAQTCEAKCHFGAEDFYAVVDTLFPRDRAEKPDENPYLILRYISPWEPERQIIIASKGDRDHVVHYDSLPNGSKSVAQQVQELHPDDPPQRLAQYIKVEHRTIRLDPKVLSNLMGSFAALRVPAELNSDTVIDGTIYDFWFVASPGAPVPRARCSEE